MKREHNKLTVQLYGVSSAWPLWSAPLVNSIAGFWSPAGDIISIEVTGRLQACIIFIEVTGRLQAGSYPKTAL